VRGLLVAAPATGLLWLAGFLAITGTPPFGLF
jgi:hydrogenase-4 component F